MKKIYIFVLLFTLLPGSKSVYADKILYLAQSQVEKPVDCNTSLRDINRSYAVIIQQNYLSTSAGQKLFRFVPNYDKIVPFEAEWPTFLKSWVRNWIPLCGNPIAGTGIEQKDFADHPFDRANVNTDRKYKQVIYRGWGLYLSRNGDMEIPGLWEWVPLKVIKIDGGPIGGPKVNGGP